MRSSWGDLHNIYQTRNESMYEDNPLPVRFYYFTCVFYIRIIILYIFIFYDSSIENDASSFKNDDSSLPFDNRVIFVTAVDAGSRVYLLRSMVKFLCVFYAFFYAFLCVFHAFFTRFSCVFMRFSRVFHAFFTRFSRVFGLKLMDLTGI